MEIGPYQLSSGAVPSGCGISMPMSVYRVLVGVACAFEVFVVRLAVSRARAKPAQTVRDCKALWASVAKKSATTTQQLRRDSYYDFARAMAM